MSETHVHSIRWVSKRKLFAIWQSVVLHKLYINIHTSYFQYFSFVIDVYLKYRTTGNSLFINSQVFANKMLCQVV